MIVIVAVVVVGHITTRPTTHFITVISASVMTASNSPMVLSTGSIPGTLHLVRVDLLHIYISLNEQYQ